MSIAVIGDAIATKQGGTAVSGFESPSIVPVPKSLIVRHSIRDGDFFFCYVLSFAD